MTSESPPFRISLWKDYVPARTLIATDSRESTGVSKILIRDNLQEEIYAWQTSEDPFDGITDTAIRNELHQLLVERLNPSAPPSKRRIRVLREFVTKAETAIGTQQVEWVLGKSQANDDDEGIAPINSLLALTLHIKWLISCFERRPGISVSVR